MSYNNGPKIVTDGLVLYLDAANNRSIVSGSNTWFDLSRNGYNGTLTNGPTYSTEVRGSIVFDGTNDYAISTNAIKIADQNRLVTVEVGFYLDSTGNDTQAPFVANRRESSGIGHGKFICNTGSIYFRLNSNVASPYEYDVTGSQASVTKLRVNDWNIVSWGMNIGTTSMNCNLMVNGYTENASGNILWNGTNPSGEDDIEIARWQNAGYGTFYKKCRIGFVRIYNRQLPTTEQLQNYHASKGRFGL